MIPLRRLAALERRFIVLAGCPHCRDWPEEVGLRIVEVIVETRPDAQKALAAMSAEADEPFPPVYGPCPGCGRVHKPRLVEVEFEAVREARR
jgi:hypothetical protein